MGFCVYFSKGQKYYYDSDAGMNYLSDNPNPIKLLGCPKEIFDCLIENCNLTLTRDQIAKRIYGNNEVGHTNINDDRRIDNHVKDLRKKLGGYKNYIKTVPKIGYKYDDPATESRYGNC